MQFPVSLSALPRWAYIVPFVVVVAGGYLFLGGKSVIGPTLAVTRGDFREEVRVSGTVVAAKAVDLGFAASGRISMVRGTVGTRVSAGTVLAQTENGDLAAALSQAEANLDSLLAGTRPEEVAIAAASVASAKAALVATVRDAYTTSDDAIHNKADALFTNARTNPGLAFNTSNATLKNTIETERAAIESVLATWALLAAQVTNDTAEEAAAQSQAYLARVSALLANLNAAINQGVSDSTVTSTTLTSYSTTVASARSNVNAAAIALTSDSANLDAAERTLALKQAGSTAETIAAQRAAVSAARAALAKTLVVAPFSGTITRMDAKIGEIVSPTTSLISMQSDGVFQIETFIPEVSIARVAPQNPATTTLDAYGPLLEFSSVVVAVDPAETVKDGVPTYKTTLSFLGADPRIRSGMTASVRITTGILRDAIVIPAGAVKNEAGASFVSVVDGDGKAEKRAVTLGASPALGQAYVLSGISEGDVILLTPAL